MIVGGLLIFAGYKLADFGLFVFQTVVISALVGLVAFVKVNGAPFHLFLLNFVQTMRKPNIRIWRKEYIKVEEHKNANEDNQEFIPRKLFLPGSKLSELSLIVDTGGVYKGEVSANQINRTAYNNLNYESR